MVGLPSSVAFLVIGSKTSKLMMRHQPAFQQQFQGIVNGGSGQTAIGDSKFFQKGIGGEWAVHGIDTAKNALPFGGLPQTPLAQKFKKSSFDGLHAHASLGDDFSIRSTL
jgi:hypothetical protein